MRSRKAPRLSSVRVRLRAAAQVSLLPSSAFAALLLGSFSGFHVKEVKLYATEGIPYDAVNSFLF